MKSVKPNLEKLIYKVTLTIGTWNDETEEGYDWEKSEKDFFSNNPVEARMAAFNYVENLEGSFSWKEWNMEHVAVGLSPKSDNSIYKNYDISIHFVYPDNQEIEIFSTYPLDSDKILFGLEKEVQILKQYKVDLNNIQHKVEYYDYVNKKKNTTFILSNGMDWNNYKINIMHSPEMKDFFDSIEVNSEKNKNNSSRKKKQKKVIDSILKEKESHILEFKSTLRFNLITRKIDSEIEFAVIKTIAAFINSSGGELIIGVDKENKVIGLEADLQTLKKSHDLLLQSFDGLLKKHFDNYGKANSLVKTYFQQIKNKEVLKIHVVRSKTGPLFVKKEQEIYFFARGPVNTRSLNIKDAISYILIKWPKYKG